MASTTFECSLVGESVQVLAERIICEVHKRNRVPPHKQLFIELRYCSKAGISNCPVALADEMNSDVSGFPYSGSKDCAYLKLIRQKRSKVSK